MVEQPPFDGPRSFLFVSADDPLGATRAVAEWADGPPDLCVSSPSPAARETAAAACPDSAERLDEPLLAGRSRGESTTDFAARTADALRTINAFETRSALVIWDSDSLFTAGGMPVVVDAAELIRQAESIEHEIPPP
jgi:hypothetical protein